MLMEDLAALEEKEENLLVVAGGGYPGAGIGGGRSWPEAVEIMLMEAVDTHGGSGEEDTENYGYNGLGGQIREETHSTGGGGYYTDGLGWSHKNKNIGKAGGQGGKWDAETGWSGTASYMIYLGALGGAGGNAGKGGNIRISPNAKINAYNGDRVTNEDYSSVYYEYDKNGNKLSEKLNVIQKKNGTNFIPTTIFAQSGTIRASYTTNSSLEELSKVKTGEKNNVAKSMSEVKLVLATNETSTATTGYKNGYKENQGIGSGAGYLEQSNGTYKVDSSLN